MSRTCRVAALFVFLTVGIGAAAAQQPGQARRDKLLVQADAFRTQYEARRGEYAAGRGTLDVLLETDRFLADTELEAADGPDARLAVLRAHCERARDVETLALCRKANAVDLPYARGNRLLAENRMKQAEAEAVHRPGP
jgi:hypothetical protein